jgi:hypothetical protein
MTIALRLSWIGHPAPIGSGLISRPLQSPLSHQPNPELEPRRPVVRLAAPWLYTPPLIAFAEVGDASSGQQQPVLKRNSIGVSPVFDLFGTQRWAKANPVRRQSASFL